MEQLREMMTAKPHRAFSRGDIKTPAREGQLHCSSAVYPVEDARRRRQGKVRRIRSLRLSTWLLCAVSLGLTAAGGCTDPDRDKRGEVSGTVTLDGQPAPSGEIRFVPAGAVSGPTSGGPIREGKYHIGYKLGPAVGENQVQFSGTRRTGRTVSVKGPVTAGTEQPEFAEAFPSKYGMTSPEKRTVKPGKNEFQFELKSD